MEKTREQKLIDKGYSFIPAEKLGIAAHSVSGAVDVLLTKAAVEDAGRMNTTIFVRFRDNKAFSENSEAMLSIRGYSTL